MTTSRPSAPHPVDGAIPIALGVLLAAVAVAPRAAGPAVTLVTSLIGVTALIVVLPRWDRIRVDRTWGRSLARPAAALVWLGLATALAPDPLVSLVGLVGQHAGWTTWFALLAWFGVATAIHRGSDARRVVIVIATLGGSAGAAIVIERIVGLTVSTYSQAPSGIFENSLSAAQFLLIGIGAAVGWLGMGSRLTPTMRAFGWASLAAGVAGLALTDSRAGIFAAAVGVVTAAALRGTRRTDSPARLAHVVTVILLGIALAGTAVLAAASTGSIGAAAGEAWSSVANDRDEIWDSALLASATRPLTGTGPDQFSALTRWTLAEDGRLDYQGTYDPHNITLWWLAAAGVPGLLLGIAAVYGVLFALLRAAYMSGAPLAVTGPIAGLVAWGTSLLFAWTNPLAAITAVTLAGVLLGSTRPAPPAQESGMWMRTLLGAGIASGILAALLVPATLVEVPFHTARGAAEQSADARQSYERWPDPVYAVAYGTSAGRIAAPSGPTIPGALVVDERDVRWDVNVVLLAALSTQAPDSIGPDERWAAFESLMRTGASVDAGSGIWDTLSALEASRRGLDDIALEYARAAQAFELTPETRARLDGTFPDLGGE